jgi:hypothetical protein
METAATKRVVITLALDVAFADSGFSLLDLADAVADKVRLLNRPGSPVFVSVLADSVLEVPK